MTVNELFIELFKLILKGKGKHHIYAQFNGWLAGVLQPNEIDERIKRVVLW